MTDKKLNVLFLASWYPNRLNPLLGIFVKRHALAVARYCNVSVIYVCADDKDEVNESIEEGIYTIRVYYKRVTSAVPIYSQWLKWRKYTKEFDKAVKIYEAKKGRPDIINANVVFPVAAIALKLKWKWNIPYVITEHWTGYFPEDGRYKGSNVQRVWKQAVDGASTVITVSERLKEQMLNLGLANNYMIISNVVDEKLFNIAPKRHDGKKEFKFIHISGLDEKQKNISGMINAFARVHEKMPAASLTIVGDGDNIYGLKALAKKLNIESAVIFTGTKTGNDLVGLLNNSDAFVLFSNYENLPCVMLEAMCCGLPVISSRVGDVPLYINATNGMLIDAGNETQLVEAMLQMIASGASCNPKGIRATVIDKVKAEAIGKQFLEVYNKVLQK